MGLTAAFAALPLLAKWLIGIGAVGTAGAGITAGWNAIGSGDKYTSDLRGKSLAELTDNEDVRAMLERMSASELRALESEYLETANDVNNLGGLWGGQRRAVDVDRLLDDLSRTVGLPGYAQDPMMEDYVGEDALKTRIDELTAPLDALRASRESAYQDELSGIRAQYDAARQGILSSQYQQNAQLADSMSSSMDRARRNALEAGASAGLRLADNINIMLSTQNQQARTSLETSNQLAQMLLNQQAASRQARSDYDSYMMQDYTARNNARAQAYNEGMQQYDVAFRDAETKRNQWDEAYSTTPAAKHVRNYNERARYTSQLQN